MKKHLLSLTFVIILFTLTAVSASAAEEPLKVGLRWGSTAMEAANLENAIGSGYEFGYFDEDRDFIYLDETDETTITMKPTAGNTVTVVETSSGRELFSMEVSEYGLGVRPIGEDTETWFKGYKYPGSFEYIRLDGGDLTVINVVDLEDYVKGVVPYEMDKEWPLAALEAQAVCARTYAAVKRHPSLGFDVCASTDCQVYYGRNRATDLTDQAVENTKGLMLYYEGEQIKTAVYCAHNGGASEDAVNVWGTEVPYLVGKEDPYEALTAIPNYNWSVTYTAEELTWILEQKGYEIGKVKDVYVAAFTPMGNVSKVTFVGSRDTLTVKGETCRTIFYSSTYSKSVKSQRFTINGIGAETSDIYVNNAKNRLKTLEGIHVISGNGTKTELDGSAVVLSSSGMTTVGAESQTVTAKDGTFTISGSGSGHNLGMSQYGAKAMAEQGYTFEEILEFYYTDITIE